MQREKRPGAAGERETGQGEEGEGGEREEDQPYIGRIVNNNRSAAVERSSIGEPETATTTTVISGLLSRHLSLTCGIEERKGGEEGCSSTDHLAKQTKDPKENSAANPRPMEFLAKSTT